MLNEQTVDNLAIAELALVRWADDKPNREARANRYTLYFAHAYTNQWLQKDEPEGDRPKISLYLSADTVRQYRAKLFPGRAEVGIKCYPETENNQNEKTTDSDTAKYENHILQTYDENEMPVKLHDQAEWFFVGGEACFYVPHDTKKIPGKGADAFIFSIDPTKVTIIQAGGKKVAGMHEQTITAQDARRLPWVKLDADISDEAILSDIYYFDQYYFARIINGDKFCSKVLKNPYETGYEIPYFWFANNAKPGSLNGNSEIRHLKIGERELNSRISDYAQRLRDGVLGAVFVSGAGSNKNISLDPDFINFLAPGGKAERLALAGDGAEYIEYFKFWLDLYQKKTTITDDVVGTKNANAAASGIALQYKFLSLQELIDEKRLVWDNGLRKINKQILYYKFGAGKKYRNKPLYANALPTDETVAAKNNALLVEAGIKSRESAIDDMNPNESAPDIMKKIKADQAANPDFYKKKAPNNFPAKETIK